MRVHAVRVHAVRLRQMPVASEVPCHPIYALLRLALPTFRRTACGLAGPAP